MRTLRLFALCMLALSAVSLQGATSRAGGGRYKLWYGQSADEWMKSVPLGNGRLGAMVFGGVHSETIALNEITMWSGRPDPFQERPLGKELLTEIRQLFFEGKYAEGNRIAEQFMSGTPHSFGSHVPLGDLKINFRYPAGSVTGYRRELDLASAVSTVSFRVGGVTYTREAFCSNPDEALIMRFASSRRGALDLELSLDLLREATVRTSREGMEFAGKVSFRRQGPGGVDFAGRLSVNAAGGRISEREGGIAIEGATEVVIVLDVRTDYTGDKYMDVCAATVNRASAQKYDILKARHVEDHSALYNRVDISLGGSSGDELPTDKRWERVKAGVRDPYLDALFFQYARYLLLAASRGSSPLPANLQGQWNDNLACNMGWTNDYHLDINTQQNYWLANVGNLHETNAPLFDYIDDLAAAGQRTARNVYGARGWAANTVANVWGYTASGAGVGWGLFPMAGVWLSTHLWTHYLYTQDEDFLRDRAYPILKSNVEFLLDYMAIDPSTGYLVTGPSTSPENSFRWEGRDLSLSMMPTCDRVLVWEAATSFMAASEILGTDPELRRNMTAVLRRLPPLKTGRNGAVQEWLEDFEEAQPNHRHTSHLLALYPFSQISPVRTPGLAEAARKTIELRLAAPGWEDVEWSRANMICYYARLGDAEKAYESVVGLERAFTRENLLTISPEGIAGAPYDIFIYDGNEAGGAGIAEMLVQSHEGYIELLPALPKAWHTGYFEGLCVRGGAEVDAKWRGGKIERASIRATAAGIFKVKLPENLASSSPRILLGGRTAGVTPDAESVISLEMKRGDTLEIVF